MKYIKSGDVLDGELSLPRSEFKDGQFVKAVIPVKTGIHKAIENTGFQPSSFEKA